MLKSEAEHMLRRACEDTGAEFTDEQIQAISLAMMKIAGRLVEEAIASWRPKPGSRPNFFTD